MNFKNHKFIMFLFCEYYQLYINNNYRPNYLCCITITSFLFLLFPFFFHSFSTVPQSLPCWCPMIPIPTGLRPPLPPLSPRSQAPPHLLHAISSPALSCSPEPSSFMRSLSSPGSPFGTQTPTTSPSLGAGGERRTPHLPGLFKLLGKGGASASSLFSTAVISGGSAVSAPCLLKHDHAVPASCAVAAIEGCGGVPPIRPLETLHNALSLRQLDAFLERMTAAPFRTPPPCASPPKLPGSLSHLPHDLQSPSNSVGWSGPPSFVSSSGPSSPNGSASLVDYFVSGDPTAPSSLSASLLSEEGGTGLLNYFSNMIPSQLAAGMFPLPPATTSSAVTPGSTASTPDDLLLEDRHSSDDEDHAPDVTVTEEPPPWPVEPLRPPGSGSTSPSSGTDPQSIIPPSEPASF
ncbi:hypothetical protein B566_EDAN007583 [Ephemera danica]|nr:hypothetical protein B566_EDAN007583 [Ephemera danica]